MSDRFAEWLANRKDDTPAPMLSDGATVGDFRIVGFLGRGGSGEVYRAEHRELKFPAAIKLLHRGDETGKARFAREAEILANHPCPGFPRFFAYGESDGHPYLAEELLEERPLPTKDRDIATLICRIAEAVGELHKLGFVHRDIKPSNILWRDATTPVLVDFGLAKPIAEDGHSDVNTISIENDHAVGVGTPGYAAPEQFAGGEIGVSADIHALGVLANECFDGKPPHDWIQVIRCATSSIQAQRPADIPDFVKAVKSRHRRRYVALVLLIAVAIAAAVIFVQRRGIGAQGNGQDIPPSPADSGKLPPVPQPPTKLGDIISYRPEYKRINDLSADATASQIIEAAIADAKEVYDGQLEKTKNVFHNPILLPALHSHVVNTFLRERGFDADMRKKYQPMIDELYLQYRKDSENHQCGMPIFEIIEPKSEPTPRSTVTDPVFEVGRIH